jgi:type III secretory pathway lipoprotein EscJ
MSFSVTDLIEIYNSLTDKQKAEVDALIQMNPSNSTKLAFDKELTRIRKDIHSFSEAIASVKILVPKKESVNLERIKEELGYDK